MSNTVKTITGKIPDFKHHFMTACERTKFSLASNVGKKIEWNKFHRAKRIFLKQMQSNSKKHQTTLNILALNMPMYKHPNKNKFKKQIHFYQWSHLDLKGGSYRQNNKYRHLYIFKRLSKRERRLALIENFTDIIRDESLLVEKIFREKLLSEMGKYYVELNKAIQKY